MQMVEIAKAVSANCKVLILDEPTSSLTANEVESLFRIMRELKEQGVALVYISHKMDEIKVIADEVTIMRDGQYIGEVAEKIIAKAKENDVPFYKDNKLAETLSKLEIGDAIPPELYEVVAEILVFVDDMDKMKAKLQQADMLS